MRSGTVSCFAMMIVVAMSVGDVAAQVCTPDAEKNFTSAYLESQLKGAGYRCEAASLVQALKDPSARIAMIAADALARVRSTPDVIVGLRSAIAGSPSHRVAVTAVRSLQTLGAAEWEEALVRRFLVMDDHDPLKLRAAGILAQTGRPDGWPFVQSILQGPLERGTRNARVRSALEQASHFDGLRDADGRVIDSVALAEAVLARARAAGVPEIESFESQVEIVKQRRAAASR